jgi:hypothetical protein
MEEDDFDVDLAIENAQTELEIKVLEKRLDEKKMMAKSKSKAGQKRTFKDVYDEVEELGPEDVEREINLLENITKEGAGNVKVKDAIIETEMEKINQQLRESHEQINKLNKSLAKLEELKTDKKNPAASSSTSSLSSVSSSSSNCICNIEDSLEAMICCDCCERW